MNPIARLLRPAHDTRGELRPLWRAVVVEARDARWYRELGAADSLAGRFDMVTLVLAVVLLRLEREDAGGEGCARLTELFIEDMDAQLRQSGVGDLVVGKHVGKLMATLGGRLGALREALGADEAELVEVVGRNATLRDGHDAAPLASALRALHARLAAVPMARLLAGELTA
ncbi:MAG: ubiquinol-cytochrome C chaperone family protein [Novosphingobium sp.]